MVFLKGNTRIGETESAVTPIDKKYGHNVVSAASSPQMLTGMFARLALSTVIRIRRKTAG